jgi:YihY family inner membrane protein
MAWTDHPKLAPVRRRSRLADVILETVAGYSKHRTGRNASLLAYMGILTVFPLLLAATTVLGIVLKNNESLRQDIVDSALSKIPVVGTEISKNQGSLPANWWAIAIGLALALWGSLRAFVAMQTALDDIWEIEKGRDNFIVQRVRALVGIGIIFIGQLGSVMLATVVSHAGLPRTGQFLLVVGGLTLNIGVVALMYRYLTSRETAWRLVWPGATFTGVLFTALQFLGTNIMSRQVANAGKVYGAFAGIIALAAWISLHGLVALVGAELNAALERIRNRVAPLADGETVAAIKHGVSADPASEAGL